MKTMKIALVHTSPKREVVEGTLYPRLNCVEGLGVAYLAAHLERENHRVKIVSEMDELGKDTWREIVTFSPDVVGFYSMTSTFPRVVEYAQRLKELDRKILTIVGGDHVSSNPYDCLPNGIDFGVKGEGEETLSGLLEKIVSGGDLRNVAGLIYRTNGGVRVNNSRTRIKNLDSLPFPKRDLEMLKHTTVGMIMAPRSKEQVATASVLTSRGCPYSCEFCSSRDVWGNSVIYRSPDNVLRELKELKEKFGTNTVFFPDLTFNANPKRAAELSDVLTDSNLGLSYYAVMRLSAPNGKELVSYEMLRKLRRAGMKKIGFGIESLAESIQDERVKKFQIEYARNVFGWCYELGILTKAFMMVGYPEDTPNTIQENIENLKLLLPTEVRISVLTPFPGTPLHKEMLAKGRILTEDLSKYDTNTPVIRVDGLSPEEVKEAQGKILREYYNSPAYKNMVNEQIKIHQGLRLPYEDFFQFLKSQKVLL